LNKTQIDSKFILSLMWRPHRSAASSTLSQNRAGLYPGIRTRRAPILRQFSMLYIISRSPLCAPLFAAPFALPFPIYKPPPPCLELKPIRVPPSSTTAARAQARRATRTLTVPLSSTATTQSDPMLHDLIRLAVLHDLI
jgi:hypothetical protein